MNFAEVFASTITNPKVISAVSSAVLIILLGFYLRKKDIISKQTSKMLSVLLLSVSIPALAYTAFMQDIDTESLTQGINLLIWGFIIYIVLIIMGKFFFMNFTGDKNKVLHVLTIFGSTTFFGIPIVGVMYGAEGIMYASIFNISYRVFLYSYGYIKMSGLKFTKDNIKTMLMNPIIIATFLGLAVWMFQGYLPQMQATNAEGIAVSAAFLRIDVTAPWLFETLNYLAKLCSPLAWIAIGAQLAEIPLKDAFRDKPSLQYSAVKVILVPAFILALITAGSMLGIFPVNHVAMATAVIMMATPTATVAAAFAISFDKEALLTSNCSLLSTILGVVAMPLWVVVVELMKGFSIFS
ncbi:AEC family transporter [Oceanobacillus sp. FSL K6-2867]|uniref:AEC family transporter n=1 Tax=Oceanobacillus sp. FSL K6-2867 TaxID=2954748 RepID=UPI0030D9C7C6